MSLLSFLFGNYNNNKATSAANAGTQQGIDTIKGFYDDAKGYMSPYMGLGNTGVQGLLGLLNDPNSIQNSEAYKWRLGQGMSALDNSAAARGALFSGGHQKDLMNYGQGLASQEYDNQWNRLFGITGLGQNAATGLGAMGMGAGRSIAELQGDIGANNASKYAQRGQNFNNFENSLFKLIGLG
jgi:hypothetical protein